MFIATLFPIGKTQKQPKCPLTDERINKIWCVHTMEYYSALRKKEILPFVTTWLDMEDTMLRETSQRKTVFHLRMYDFT